MSRPLRAGERVILVDAKKRQYLITLADEAEFHSHSGVLPHVLLIGQEEGTAVRSTGGGKYLAIRPTLSEFVLKMPRGAQVIYPKDLGPILMMADIFPGARVLESGVGSGALSMTMLRMGADIVGYELREDFARKAQKNVQSFLGDHVMDRYRVEVRNAYDGIDETGLDRIVLDLPEPWNVVPHAVTSLRSGGIILAYLPTINQTARFRRTLAQHGFSLAETMEVMNRGWHIEAMSVRPDHRMVAHTGFLTSARWLAGDAGARGIASQTDLGFPIDADDPFPETRGTDASGDDALSEDGLSEVDASE
jgi:tRNA (adenine57-N1/adenine58-N1)-methyltransferase catalytic subunit